MKPPKYAKWFFLPVTFWDVIVYCLIFAIVFYWLIDL